MTIENNLNNIIKYTKDNYFKQNINGIYQLTKFEIIQYTGKNQPISLGIAIDHYNSKFILNKQELIDRASKSFIKHNLEYRTAVDIKDLTKKYIELVADIKNT